ncbi:MULTISPECIES: nucleotidyltransferase domain-containing protein [Microbacterium]|jgi:hypothetical protein|uniref:nucleotidyltransferase domain-containing protein n=1 Tax=Microbacterium TaxID=33882 RepID=UPI001D176571|nr:nucleotidyltransferase domain-containing protein [Microbacterium testaceum]MCC4249698.1 aminoglycoside 6-adenylyltransferase [Microbacterium testaceum]
MSYPEPLSAALDRIVSAVSTDPRFEGVAAGGSLLNGTADEFSDLDLVLVVADAHYRDVMDSRVDLAAGWGRLLAAFTGEHVGEPRLLICLFDEPLLHVDLKFVTVADLDERIEDPLVLWERDTVITRRLATASATPLAVDPQWIEDRFWVWVHYGATKLGRGEIFETVDFLSFLRANALAPLASHLRGHEPRGVRRAETLLPDVVPALAGTIPGYDVCACVTATRRTIALYRQLREQLPLPVRRGIEAEAAAVRYFEMVAFAVAAKADGAGRS